MSKPPRKPPIVRKGQKKPYVKGTNDQLQERIEETAGLLAMGATKTEIHKVVGGKHNVVWRTVDIYIARARKWLEKQADRTQEQVRSESVNWYERQLKSSGAALRDKIKCRERLDEIYGIDAPKRQQISTPEGEPLEIAATVVKPDGEVAISEEQLAQVLERLHARRQAAAGVRANGSNGEPGNGAPLADTNGAGGRAA